MRYVSRNITKFTIAKVPIYTEKDPHWQKQGKFSTTKTDHKGIIYKTDNILVVYTYYTHYRILLHYYITLLLK